MVALGVSLLPPQKIENIQIPRVNLIRKIANAQIPPVNFVFQNKALQTTKKIIGHRQSQMRTNPVCLHDDTCYWGNQFAHISAEKWQMFAKRVGWGKRASDSENWKSNPGESRPPYNTSRLTEENEFSKIDIWIKMKIDTDRKHPTY